MKVGCRQCGASYSVADEKVAGKKLKLRCKKCGEPMVIDASAQDSMPFGPKLQIVTPEPDEPAQSEWFVAVDDQPQGPYTLHELQSHYAAGLIARDALVFREGLADWTRAQDVPELRNGAPQPGARGLPPASTSIDGDVQMGRDPFADPVPAYSAPSPRVSAEELLSGPPRDGTVQFSLDDIRALSAISSPSVTAAAPARPGYASGDGSGLIDVRSLSESAPPPDTFRAVGSDLTASPLDTMAPFALPPRAQRAGVDFRTKVLAGVASFGFLLAGAVGVLAITRTPPQAAVAPVAGETLPQTAAATVAASAAQPAAAAAVAAAPKGEAGADEEKAHAEVEREPAMGSERDVAADEDRASRPTKRRRAARAGAPAAKKDDESERTAAKSKSGRAGDIDDLLAKPAAKEEPAPAKADKPAAASKGGSDDLDALLLGAIDGKKSAPAKKDDEPAESALPKTPSRDQVLAALGKAKTKAAKCKGTGVATANITIANTGRVSSVAVSGVEGGAKSCVESAVRSTKFPKFQEPSFAVKFPFKLGG